MARPEKDINPESVRILAGAFCTDEEIGAKLGCSSDTLTRRFAEALKEGRDDAKGSLRSKQMAVAMKGSIPMLIWLGKQYLGQRDKSDIEHDFTKLSDADLIALAAGSVPGTGTTGADTDPESQSPAGR